MFLVLVEPADPKPSWEEPVELHWKFIVLTDETGFREGCHPETFLRENPPQLVWWWSRLMARTTKNLDKESSCSRGPIRRDRALYRNHHHMLKTRNWAHRFVPPSLIVIWYSLVPNELCDQNLHI